MMFTQSRIHQYIQLESVNYTTPASNEILTNLFALPFEVPAGASTWCVSCYLAWTSIFSKPILILAAVNFGVLQQECHFVAIYCAFAFLLSLLKFLWWFIFMKISGAIFIKQLKWLLWCCLVLKARFPLTELPVTTIWTTKKPYKLIDINH